MAGLLLKDWKLMMQQKNTLLMVGVIAVMVAIGGADPGFVITYLTIIGVMYTMNTLSYDGADNGNAFLFTLPITRKEYVVEKYIFSILGGGAMCLYGVVLAYVISVVKGVLSVEYILMNIFAEFLLIIIILSFLLPIELKFGVEKARIIIVVVTLLLFAFGMAVAKVGNSMYLALAPMLSQIEERPELAALAALAAAVAVLGISCRISIGIMNKKEL